MELDTIVVGDCLDVMKSIPNKCVDLIITDPPFATPVLTASTRDGVKNIGDFSIVEGYFKYTLFPEMRRISSSKARWYIFCDNIFYPVLFRASYELFKPNPQLLVWNKGKIGFGFDYRKTFELITYIRQRETSRLNTNGKAKRDILYCPPVPLSERIHPAQKPEGLILQLMDDGGNLVFDPFMGSGTTAVAALKLGRHFYGCDINEDYVKLANERVEKARLEMAQLRMAV